MEKNYHLLHHNRKMNECIKWLRKVREEEKKNKTKIIIANS